MGTRQGHGSPRCPGLTSLCPGARVHARLLSCALPVPGRPLEAGRGAGEAVSTREQVCVLETSASPRGHGQASRARRTAGVQAGPGAVAWICGKSGASRVLCGGAGPAAEGRRGFTPRTVSAPVAAGKEANSPGRRQARWPAGAEGGGGR